MLESRNDILISRSGEVTECNNYVTSSYKTITECYTISREEFPDFLAKTENSKRIIILSCDEYPKSFSSGKELFNFVFGSSVTDFLQNKDNKKIIDDETNLMVNFENTICYSFLKALENGKIIETNRNIDIIINKNSRRVKYVIKEGAIYFNIGYYQSSSSLKLFKRDMVCVLYNNNRKQMITLLKQNDVCKLMNGEKVKLNPFLLALRYNTNKLTLGLEKVNNEEIAKNMIMEILFFKPLEAKSCIEPIVCSNLEDDDKTIRSCTALGKKGDYYKFRFTDHLKERQEERVGEINDHSIVTTFEHGDEKNVSNYKQYTTLGITYLVWEKSRNYILDRYVLVILVGIDKSFFEFNFQGDNRFQKNLVKYNKLFLKLFLKSLDLEKIRPAKIENIPIGCSFLFFIKKNDMYFYLIYEISYKNDGLSYCECRLNLNKSYSHDQSMNIYKIETFRSEFLMEGSLSYDTPVFSVDYMDPNNLGLVNIAVTIFQDSS